LIDLRTVSPFDEAAIFESVAKTRRAVIVHEAVKPFGVGAEIAARIHEKLHGELLHPVVRLGAPPCPVPFSKVLENAFLPSERAIESAIDVAMS
jgi:pyruvate/2-oxoglutarate/acetoin dehydrogenase E1 component